MNIKEVMVVNVQRPKNQALPRDNSWSAVNVLTKVNIKILLVQNSLLGFVFYPKSIFAIKKISHLGR